MKISPNNPHKLIRKKLLLSCLIPATLIAYTPAAIALDDIRIVPRERLLTSQSLGIITLRMEVENRSSRPQELQEKLDLPEGWNTISSLAPFVLSAGKRDVRIIHVIVPQSAEAKTYPVNYSVYSISDPNINSLDTVNIRVKDKLGAELSLVSPLKSLLEGESYELEFQLKNKGNKTTAYNIKLQDYDNYVTHIEPLRLEVPAKGTGKIIVRGKIPQKIVRTGTHSISLLAKRGRVTAKESVDIPIISRTPEGIGTHHKLHGELTIAHNINNNHAGTTRPQIEYKAKGTLDEDGKHKLKVIARTDGGDGAGNRLNARSEYSLSYRNDDVLFNVGNHSFNAGRLAGHSLFGTGAELSYSPKLSNGRKPFTFRAFEAKSRSFSDEKIKSKGLITNFRFNSIGFGGTNYEYETSDGKKETIKTISASLNNRYFSFRGTQGEDDDGTAEAYDLSIHSGKLGVNFNWLDATPEFDGGEDDTKQRYGSLYYQINDRTSLSFNKRQGRENLKEDTTKEIRESNGKDIRLSHIFGDAFQHEFVLGYRQLEEKDLRPNPTVDRNVKAVTAEYRRNLDDLVLQVLLESGKRDDRIDNGGTGNKVDVSASWSPSRKLDLNVDLAVDRHLDSEGIESTLGVNGYYKLSPRSSFKGYWNKVIRHREGSQADNFDITYTRKFDNQGELNLTARQTFVTSDGDISRTNVAWLAEYSIPLDIPIRKRHNIGSFWGKLYNPETREPIPNAVVQLDGQYAVSDAKGEFTYPELVARMYQLRLDSTRKDNQGFLLGYERPYVNVNVTPNHKKTMNLPVRRGASIKGRLLQYIPDAKAAVLENTDQQIPLVAKSGVSNILIELHPTGKIGKRTIQKRLTYSDGSFNFYGIAPGEWQMVINDDSNMPEHFRMENRHYNFKLESGDMEQVDLRAIPINQTIKKVGPTGGFRVAG